MSIYTVSQINTEMKRLIETHPTFQSVFVRGEISNCKYHSSGHCYFSLKDREAAVSCVLFHSDLQRLRFRLENGLAIVVRGRVRVYPKTGQVQLAVFDAVPDGVGVLQLQFEQIKAQLEQEGLFDASHKKPLPDYPKTIGIVTSPTGAAVQDMIRILRRRFPCAEVLIYPALVQGAGAAKSLIHALQRLDRDGLADLAIIGRGGGSTEDLWSFCDEELARTVFALRTPIISAVGHEPDVVLTDFVADLRAATPSAAAELATPNREDLLLDIAFAMQRAQKALCNLLEARKQELLQEQRLLLRYAPEQQIASWQQRLSVLQQRLEQAGKSLLTEQQFAVTRYSERLHQAIGQLLQQKQQDFAQHAASLDALSPLRVLSRGYVMALDEQENRISCAAALKENDRLLLKFSDGTVTATVRSIQKNEV